VALSALFVVAGVLHFVIPGFYLAMMPPWLPAHALLVQLSGVAEIAGGIGVVRARTQRAAAWGLIALLVAVFPANIQMLLNAIDAHAATTSVVALVVRLAFQPLLIWWVWRTALVKAPGRDP
jgi:uncharacterized membrane protein